MIELKQVSKRFGTTVAVRDVSFTVKEQENFVLLGTSGCGKTTTLKMINKLIRSDEGTITIEGKDIVNEDPQELRRKIGYVMQNIGLFPHYTIAENIAIVPKLLKWDKQKTRIRIRELIEKLHLPEECLKQLPQELSGGQQQRVGLARALVADPPLLLMDEPFGALDNVTRTSIQEEFKALEEFKRKTIMMVTHDVQEAFELADRICLMDAGNIVQIGTPKELLYRPANDFARKFLDGQRLALEFRVARLHDVWDIGTGEQLQLEGDAVPADLTVWTAMELLRSAPGRQFQVKSENVGPSRSFGFQELTHAFNQYQTRVDHE